MYKYLLIAAGGATGSMLRYFISTSTHLLFKNTVFPWGTLMVNITGSFIIGLLAGIDEGDYFSPGMKLFLFIGILGGYTTFSAFSLETINLFKAGEMIYAITNIIASNLFGLLAAFAGYFLANNFHPLVK